jgi:hypothetical protein
MKFDFSAADLNAMTMEQPENVFATLFARIVSPGVILGRFCAFHL